MPKKFNALLDAMDTFLRTPATVTEGRCHVRDAVDMKRIMITVMMALCPALLFGWWNVGYQHFLSMGYAPTVWGAAWYGFLKWLPLVIVTYISGLGVEVLFSQIRKEEVAEGFFVTGFIIPMIMPPDVPLWIVALATAFAVLFGKEVFGGTGYNFLNPALLARAFVFFAYPSVISGDKVWISAGADAVTGATPLSLVMNPRYHPRLHWGDLQDCHPHWRSHPPLHAGGRLARYAHGRRRWLCNSSHLQSRRTLPRDGTPTAADGGIPLRRGLYGHRPRHSRTHPHGQIYLRTAHRRARHSHPYPQQGLS